MAFDAVKIKESKKEKASSKERKIQKQIDRINKVYPIHGVTSEGFIKTKVGFREAVYEIFSVKKYDLFLLDNTESDYVTESNWEFNKLYPFPIKEIYMNFPEENQEQQEYFKHKIERATTPKQLEALNTELEKLKHIEKYYEMRDTYMCVFAPSVEELKKRIELLERFNHFLELKSISIEKKKKIIYKLNNQL